MLFLQENAIGRLKTLLADGTVAPTVLDKKQFLHQAAWMGYDRIVKVSFILIYWNLNVFAYVYHYTIRQLWDSVRRKYLNDTSDDARL